MLARLVLTDFRNHAALTLTPAAGLVVLTGPNGAGKTNVLEALSLLAPGRGLRRAGVAEMARIGGSGAFGVAATLTEGSTLGTGTRATAPDRRLVRINGADSGVGALAERIAMLWLTPAMDRLFLEPAGERRRFLDRLTLALSPAHARATSRYEAATRERNRLLTDPRADRGWIDAVEARMAQYGTMVHAGRAATVDALDAALAMQPGGDFARAAIALEGWEGDEATLAATLRDMRARDAAAGRALAGPHRADLSVTHVDKGRAAALASTGEQKALLLGIVLAHAELVAQARGAAPVLLLDEVAAHLDPVRRAALYARLRGIGQVWMTGTEPALFEAAADAHRITL